MGPINFLKSVVIKNLINENKKESGGICRFSVQTLSDSFLFSPLLLWRLRQGFENLTILFYSKRDDGITLLASFVYLTFQTSFLCFGFCIFLPKFEAFSQNLSPR